jgi:hypothetical protein
MTMDQAQAQVIRTQVSTGSLWLGNISDHHGLSCCAWSENARWQNLYSAFQLERSLDRGAVLPGM